MRQFVDGGDVLFRRHHPAQTPSGHAKILGKAVDDENVVGKLQRGAVALDVSERKLLEQLGP